MEATIFRQLDIAKSRKITDIPAILRLDLTKNRPLSYAADFYHGLIGDGTMPCVAVFGRGPAGGLLAGPHLQQIKTDPDILSDVYVVAGIDPDVPVTMGPANFRYLGAGAPEPSFVCPEATCRRHLPTYVAQLDHNVPQVALAAPALGLPHAGAGAGIGAINFIHRTATNGNQLRNHIYAPPPLQGMGPVVGYGSGFAMYYTFGSDTFSLVMEMGGNLWHVEIPRAAAPVIRNLIRHGFNLAPSGPPHVGSFDCLPNGAPPGFVWGVLSPTVTPYGVNLRPQDDLANLQLLCGPCNATKNAGGHPLIQPLAYG